MLIKDIADFIFPDKEMSRDGFMEYIQKAGNAFYKRQKKAIEKEYRKLGIKEARGEDLKAFQRSLRESNAGAVKKFLESGMNPDYLSKNQDYYDRNPLTVIITGSGHDDDFAAADTEIIQLLIKYGANVRLRPYIWWVLAPRVLTEEDYVRIAEGWNVVGATTESLMLKRLELLIQAGADVDRKGAPYRILFPATDANYHKYFEKEGSRPINYAIEKNLPAIVDLLSRYTVLDKESLETAKLSKNPLMIEKINRLWEKQKDWASCY